MLRKQNAQPAVVVLFVAFLWLPVFGQAAEAQTRKPLQKRPADVKPKSQQPPAMSADPFDIKGLILGMSHNELTEKIGDKCKLNLHGGCELSQKEVAADYKQIAGYGARLYQLRFREDRLVRLRIISYADGFSSLALGLREKFSRPNGESTEEVTTRGGMRLHNSILTWNRLGQTLSIERFFGDIETSSLLLEDDEFALKEAEELRQQRRKSL